MRQIRKKHGLSAWKGTKLEITKSFKRKKFITQKFSVLSLNSVWRLHLFWIVLDCSGLFLLVPGRSGLFWLVLPCSDWLRVVLGRYFFYKRSFILRILMSIKTQFCCFISFLFDDLKFFTFYIYSIRTNWKCKTKVQHAWLCTNMLFFYVALFLGRS